MGENKPDIYPPRFPGVPTMPNDISALIADQQKQCFQLANHAKPVPGRENKCSVTRLHNVNCELTNGRQAEMPPKGAVRLG
ncbi:hypothetical protein M514_05449 [Trichuris suis]|uniref:Uncharacterized protein n=1 Tax=Trichuris suis TaxID=68888 RepID=A0A085NSL7_9BILA|nr:hypothetical protein M514_05449 [Trichuris suis]